MTPTLDPFDATTWDEDQAWYFNGIDKALREGRDLNISNGKTEHAVFLIQRFLANASSVIRLLSGCLRQKSREGVDIYSNPHVLDAAKRALGSGVKVVVVLQAEMDAEDGQAVKHPLVRSALELQRGGGLTGALAVFRATDRSMDWLREAELQYHWMTMDDRAYRLETEIEKAKALVNFGKPKTVASLNAVFDRTLLIDATPVFGVAH